MLTRTAQMGSKIEAVEGVEEALAADDFTGNFKEDSTEDEINRYERGLTRPTLTGQGELAGQRKGTRAMTEELVGGAAGTAAPWHTRLRGMGFSVAALKVVEVGAVTNGPFRTGEAIGNNAVQGAATATGIFVWFIAGEPNKAVYLPVAGAFADTDTMYNYEAGQASAAVDSAPADAGWGFAPQSETDEAVPPSLTFERRVGGLRHTIVGARGTGGLKYELGAPVLLSSSFVGCPVYDADGVTPRAGAAVAGVPGFSAAPKVAKGITADFRLSGGAAYAPVLTMLDFQIENTLAPRPTIGASVADSGYLATRITGRRITCQVDPEFVAPGTFNYPRRFVEGDTFEILAAAGSPSHTHGLVIAYAPRAQLTGNLTFGDRDGQLTVPATAVLTGDGDDELRVFHVFV